MHCASSCPIVLRLPGVALLLRVAWTERPDFPYVRLSSHLANGSPRYSPILENFESGQKCSVRTVAILFVFHKRACRARIERNQLLTTKRPVEFTKRSTASASLRIAM